MISLSAFYKTRYLVNTTFFLFLPHFCVSQTPVKVTYGDLASRSISVEEFKEQKKLIVPDNFKLDTVKLFFSIPDRQYVTQLNYYPYYDSINFFNICNKLVAGSWVSFQITLTEQLQKKQSTIDLSYVFYGIHKVNQEQPESPLIAEFDKLSRLDYTSGTIYFSGVNFPNVIAFRVNGNNLLKLRELFAFCAPGSIIVFEEALYRDENNRLFKLNKRFELEQP